MANEITMTDDKGTEFMREFTEMVTGDYGLALRCASTRNTQRKIWLTNYRKPIENHHTQADSLY